MDKIQQASLRPLVKSPYSENDLRDTDFGEFLLLDFTFTSAGDWVAGYSF